MAVPAATRSSLNGDYSPGLTFGATTLANVETLLLAAGHSYNLATDDANVAAGQTLTVDASALAAGSTLTLDGSAETDGTFHILGGAGNDQLALGAALTAASQIDGGAGNDTLSLSGDYSAGVTFGAATLTNVETLLLAGGHSYNFTAADATVASGATLTVDASALAAGDALSFNGAAETNGAFHILGGAGNDRFAMGAVLTAADQIGGGAGNDTLSISGDYSAGFTFGAATMTGIETLQLGAGHSYNLTTNDANVAAGATLAVDGSALGAGNTLIFNGSAETDGSLAVAGGAGNDQFTMGAALTASDRFDGGAGNDTLALNGDYSGGVLLGAATIADIEALSLASGHSYSITTDDANISTGATLTVDASALGAANVLTFNAAAETDGSLSFLAGAGNDVLTGGGGNDIFDLTHGGNDTVHGGGGNDTFTLAAALTAADSIDGGAGSDMLVLNGSGYTAFTFGAATMTNVETLQLAGAAATASRPTTPTSRRGRP